MSQSRRQFLKTLGALTAVGAGQFGVNLASMSTLAAQTSGSDYKAIVCLFLNGGNDQTNMLVPMDGNSYNEYAAMRPAIALPSSQLIKINPDNVISGRQFGLHTQLTPLANLFDQGKAAIVSNVGPLIAPITKAQYTSRTVPIPRHLFSHNDQQSTWQSMAPEGAPVGWGGKMGDILQSGNSNPVFTCVSAAGQQVFLAGNRVRTYPVGYDGVAPVSAASYNIMGATASSAAFKELITSSSDHMLETEYTAVIRRAMDAHGTLSNSLTSAPALTLPAEIANMGLARQLRIIARMISIQASLGMKRQVFFVSLGGFDTHNNQLVTQSSLFNQLAKCIEYFYNATLSMGMGNNVTLFTASDFGRTGISNGNGSDHGWGSHHLVVGGAVKGKKMYGTFPTLVNNGPDDIGSGRLIPTTSVEQYASTLGSWFGVSDSDMATIFPNLRNYSTKNLGFL